MKIWKFEGHDLDELRAALDDRELAYRVQFADDGNGLKVKVNDGMWSLDLGVLQEDPRWDCGATYGERITGQPSVWPSN